jgi:hypothetical protein
VCSRNGRTHRFAPTHKPILRNINPCPLESSASKNGVSTLQAKETRGPVLWPVLLVIFGVLLLLDNFLLLGDFNVAGLLPLLLVVAGAQILLRGDLLPESRTRSFGITRGSVEAGTLEISAGAIDVEVHPLTQPGRLIAGQFGAESRPRLTSEGSHATLRFYRADTPWYSFGDWQIGIARDLPWQVFASSHVGQLSVNLEGVIVQDVIVASGIGDIHFVCPTELLGTIQIRSTLGTIHILTPVGVDAQIMTEAGLMCTVHHDATRYQLVEPNVYTSLEADDSTPLIEVRVSGGVGDIYLA